jgi:hypothetical protein
MTAPDAFDDETPERRAEIRRLADAVRSIIEGFVATTAPLEVFHGIADDLEEIAARFDDYPQEHLFTGFAEAGPAGDSLGPYDHSPFMGLSNPLAPPMLLSVEGDRVLGTVTCGSAYEGPRAMCTAGSWRPCSTSCWVSHSRCRAITA